MKFRMVAEFNVTAVPDIDAEILEQSVTGMSDEFSNMMESGDYADQLLDVIAAATEISDQFGVDVSTTAVTIEAL